MWIFGRHRHLSSAALSEYLDGRLHGSQREKVSRQLNSCTTCREELEGLRATMSLLRDLPDMPVPRNFTLAGPPPVLVAQSPPRLFRAPSWAYAGAASLAGLALAVMVSADATGLLTTPATSTPQEIVTAPALAPTPAPLPTSAPAASANSAEALPPAQAESTSTPQPGSMQALQAAEAPKSAEAIPGPTAPAAESDQAPQPESAQALSGPQATTAEDSGISGPRGSASPAGPAGPAGPSGEETPDLAKSGQEAGATTEVPTSQPGQATTITSTAKTQTPLVWRVLEGVAAALLVLFLVVLTWRWRSARRPTAI